MSFYSRDLCLSATYCSCQNKAIQNKVTAKNSQITRLAANFGRGTENKSLRWTSGSGVSACAPCGILGKILNRIGGAGDPRVTIYILFYSMKVINLNSVINRLPQVH